MTRPAVKFQGYNCHIQIESYVADRTVPAIRLVDIKDGSPVATASVYLEDSPRDLKQGETWIKTWSENEGMLEALVGAGIVEYKGVYHPVNQYGSKAQLVRILV